jgi:flagellar biosynthetic protein FliO
VNEALLTVRTAMGMAVVLGLLGLVVWALRRGSLGLSRLAPRGAISVETALSIGDRRSLAIVGVEGRRMLVGLTPTTISFLTELGPKTTPTAPAEAPS